MVVVRSALFEIYFWIVTAVMNLAFVPGLLFDRTVTVRGQTAWAKLVMFGLRIICGIRYEVRGASVPYGGAALVASKHMSAWDTIITHVIFDDPAVIIKKELMKLPIYSDYCRKSGMIPVDREAGPAALKDMVRAAKDRIAQGRPLLIYPEGTRTTPGDAPDYKPGVAALYGQLNVPCIPVALNSGRHWPTGTFLKHPGTIIVSFLPAIAPGLKRRAFMAELETRIEAETAVLLGTKAPSDAPPPQTGNETLPSPDAA
ncbi:MAG: lysophospholipid acyltransferase family protein [Pseudomonadota bacterium]